MKTKHTPGPWIKFDDRICNKHGNAIVALDQDADCDFLNDAAAECANAHLIAAAPCMLEALEATLTNDRVMNALPAAHRRLIMDAVARARGEA
jgi:hypothetical protein